MDKEECFKKELANLLNKYDVYIWGKDVDILYDSEKETLFYEGVIIELKGGD